MRRLLISGLLGLAVFCRFWQLGYIPPGLNRDEASIGYTAYSILQTGRDEYGSRIPLSIKSFGDWKLPAYVYITIPFVGVLGLDDWVVRLPSALAGAGTIAVVYLLTNSVTAALVLALLPWHIHFSRAAYEANLGLLFFTLGIYFVVKAKKFTLAAIFFGLTLFTYHTYQIFTPLFLIGLFWLKKINYKELTVFGVFLIFAILMTFSGGKTKSSVSFLADPVFIHSKIETPRFEASNKLLGRLIYNRPVIFGTKFAANYLNSFSPDFLALKGGEHPIHNFPDMGNIFWFEYPLLLAGAYFLVKEKNQNKLIILMWLALAPVASSLTKDAPNSARLSPMIVPLAILIALGLDRLKKTIFYLVLGLVFIYSAVGFYRSYFVSFPLERGIFWGAGYRQLAGYLNLPENIDKQVVMEKPNWSPYIWLLFYSEYDPAVYQKEAVRFTPTEDGFEHVKSFSRYEFTELDPWELLHPGQLAVKWADSTAGPKTTITAYDKEFFGVFEK